MAGLSARIELSEDEITVLRKWVRDSTTQQRHVDRARIILLCHEGLSVRAIAARLNTRPARVSKWRQRFAKLRMNAFDDAPRTGKPHTYAAEMEKRVLKLLDQA